MGGGVGGGGCFGRGSGNEGARHDYHFLNGLQYVDIGIAEAKRLIQAGVGLNGRRPRLAERVGEVFCPIRVDNPPQMVGARPPSRRGVGVGGDGGFAGLEPEQVFASVAAGPR